MAFIYEFAPMEEWEKEYLKRSSLDEVEVGVNYAMIFLQMQVCGGIKLAHYRLFYFKVSLGIKKSFR